MTMFTYLVEFLSLVLFIGCVWHATRFEGRGFAQQWFVGAYLYAFIRETITQVFLQTDAYAPTIMRLGAAPAFVGLLWGSVFYLALQFARRFVPPERGAATAALVFAIAASIALPIEAEAAQLHWWLYEGTSATLFGGVPWDVPLVWGAGAVIFFAVFSKVTQSRLPDRGKLYAMVTLSPAIAAAHLLFALVLGAV
ncbi:MAG: hypothetical protein M1482_05110 [Chloroflexi bacterium]|nr:hypothetical protein [Chloroflexota bacterium]